MQDWGHEVIVNLCYDFFRSSSPLLSVHLLSMGTPHCKLSVPFRSSDKVQFHIYLKKKNENPSQLHCFHIFFINNLCRKEGRDYLSPHWNIVPHILPCSSWERLIQWMTNVHILAAAYVQERNMWKDEVWLTTGKTNRGGGEWWGLSYVLVKI